MTVQLNTSCGGPPAPRQRTLIVYKAVIRVTLESSTLHISPAFDLHTLARKLSVRPPVGRVEGWPPELTNDLSTDVALLGLAHLKNLFGMTALLPEASPDEMRQATYRHFLDTDPGKLQDASAYRRLLVEGGIYEDLNAYWEHTHEETGQLPPGLTGELTYRDESDVDLYMKNLIRADLIERMVNLKKR